MHFAVVEATKRGNLDVLKWWVNSYYQGRELDDEEDGKDGGRVNYTIVSLAVAIGHLNILEWLKELGV